MGYVRTKKISYESSTASATDPLTTTALLAATPEGRLWFDNTHARSTERTHASTDRKGEGTYDILR